MCGRFKLSKPVQVVADLFSLPVVPEELRPRDSVFPSQPVPVVRAGAAGRELAAVQWGFVPRWSKEAKPKVRPINARSETVASNGLFRASFRDRRCLIPADGFYEWPKVGEKLATLFTLRGDGLFAMAGLWDRRPPATPTAEDELDTATIVTTEANELLAALPHERMPVILDRADFARWLDPATPTQELLGLLRPYPATLMDAVPVGRAVNRARPETLGLFAA